MRNSFSFKFTFITTDLNLLMKNKLILFCNNYVALAEELPGVAWTVSFPGPSHLGVHPRMNYNLLALELVKANVKLLAIFMLMFHYP